MLQVQLYEQIQKLHFNELVKAIGGDGVISGLEVTAAGGMDLNVSAGEAIIGGTRVSFSATTVTISAADPLYPRKDIVVAKSDGTIEVVQGTPDSPLPGDRTGVFTVTPRPPDPPSNSIVLAEIWVPAGATEITSGDITDRRIFVAPSEYATGKIYADQIAEKTPGAGITLLNVSKHQGGIQTDSISELTSGAGIDIGAGSLYVNQSLKLIRWKQKKYALYLNGENAYVEAPNFFSQKPFTLMMVVKVDKTQASFIFDTRCRTFAEGGKGIYIADYTGDGVYLAAIGDGTTHLNSGYVIDLSDLRKHTVIITCSSTTMKVYVDGELKGTLDVSDLADSPLDESPTLNIGRDFNGTFYFAGKIYSLMLWNEEITDVDALMNNPQSPPTSNLVCWLNFDEGYGDKAYDLSGNGNHGTIYNAEWVEDEIYAGSRFPRNRYGLLYAAEIRQLGAGGINLGDGALYVDQANKRVGIRRTSPVVELDALYKDSAIAGFYVFPGAGFADVAPLGTVTVTAGTLYSGGPHKRGSDSRWEVDTFPATLTIDLGFTAYQVVAVVFGTHWRRGTRIPKDYVIEYSTDGSTWHTYASVTGNTNPFVVHKKFVDARYFRITVNAPQDGAPNAILAGLGIYVTEGAALHGAMQWTSRGNDVVLAMPDGAVRPPQDNYGSLGTDSYRWKLVRAVTVTQGDIGFGPEDQPCPICGKRFEVGDVVVFKVHKVLGNGEFRARPIHLKCAG